MTKKELKKIKEPIELGYSSVEGRRGSSIYYLEKRGNNKWLLYTEYRTENGNQDFEDELEILNDNEAYDLINRKNNYYDFIEN